MNTTCVVYSPQLGVYLGECLGLNFWSKLDPVGQDCAVTFESERAARDFIARHTEHCPVNDLRVVAATADHHGFATISECVRVGLPAWNPASPAHA